MVAIKGACNLKEFVRGEMATFRRTECNEIW